MTTLSTSLPNQDVVTRQFQTRREVRNYAHEFIEHCTLKVDKYVFVIWNEMQYGKKLQHTQVHDGFLILSEEKVKYMWAHIHRMTANFPVHLNVFAFENFEDACLYVKDLKQ
jgi:hypothetical protein